MPLREDLLTPIPGDNPSGTYLYYAPIYDKIKEARRQDDDTGPSGVWTRERKVADWNQVIKLAGEALATQSKDLQLAAWLSEAYLKKEGFGVFKDSLAMIRQLVETFWDTLYPEIEDGDAEFRATPLSWLGNFDLQIRMAPLTRGGLNSVDYKVASGVGYKAAAEQEGYQKLEEFNAKIAEGKMSLDDFDADFDKTPKAFYVSLQENFDGCLDELEKLQEVCEQKFGDDAPGFSKLRTALEETRNTVRSLLNRKREKEPDEPVASDEPVEQDEPAVEETPAYESASAAPAAAPVKKKAGSLSAEPQDADDALARIVSGARFLRQLDMYSPAPYLMLAGFRFGELRAAGETIDATHLEAPPTEIRQQMKKASLDSTWDAVLKTCEEALALPCARGWLDLHRYAARACTELGWYYQGLKRGIISEVRGILQDYPDLHKMTLLDDTPTANGETIQWIESEVLPPAASAAPAAFDFPAPTPQPSYSQPGPEDLGAPPDAWELAQQALRAGRVREAVELIDREAKIEPSGRGRFIRKTQLARIFIDSGNEPMAIPLLQQLATEIDTRALEDWEPSDIVSHPLSLLYRCRAREDRDGEEAKKLYAKLCRLDPVAAMSLLR